MDRPGDDARHLRPAEPALRRGVRSHQDPAPVRMLRHQLAQRRAGIGPEIGGAVKDMQPGLMLAQHGAQLVDPQGLVGPQPVQRFRGEQGHIP
ncbi:MAG: hypothetical protein WDM96_16750 [Lacunisphaera sp.]